MTDSLAPTTPTELPLRPQDEVECRRCEVHCDKVVYPGACLERACAFVYAYEAFGHTYMWVLLLTAVAAIPAFVLARTESAQREQKLPAGVVAEAAA